MAKDTIGIDVSKDRLDAFWHSRTEACCLPNTPEGFGQLCDWLGKEEDVLIVFEATGAYHRGLERHLSLAGLSAAAKGRQSEEGRHYGHYAAHHRPCKHLAARTARLAA